MEYKKIIERLDKAFDDSVQANLDKGISFDDVMAMNHKKAATEEEILQIKQAAENDDSAAQYALGMLYLKWPGNGIEQDSKMAEEWLTKSADAGDTEAMVQLLGEYHGLHETESVKCARKKILDLLLEGAASGNPDAQGSLGHMYFCGLFDTPQDKEKGFNLIRDAAIAGHTGSIIHLMDIIKEEKIELKYPKNS